MKIMTILGTRPEIIRLSLIIRRLDRWADRHVLVHTGQNYDRALSDVFFEELGVRKPDIHIRLSAHSFGRQVGQIFAEVEQALMKEKPDRVLVLGDTNSALSAVVAERLGIPVYHMEAGNRCYDWRVPEEINRRVIDAVSSFNLPYTPGSRENLLREGMDPTRIWMSGNPIWEVLEHFRPQVEQSGILESTGVSPGKYFLLTAHRAENVDVRHRLQGLMEGLGRVSAEFGYPVICSIHPRTKVRMEEFGIKHPHPLVRFYPPFSFFDFVRLEKEAFLILTDSGTVQEEACIFGVPAVTIRDTTERPETIVCGSNTLSGVDPGRIVSAVKCMGRNRGWWKPPEGYLEPDVSLRVAQYILGGQKYV